MFIYINHLLVYVQIGFNDSHDTNGERVLLENRFAPVKKKHRSGVRYNINVRICIIKKKKRKERKT